MAMPSPSQMNTETRRLLQPLWNSFEANLSEHLRRGILLCVSGGADSRALLEAVALWSGRHGGKFRVVAVDHCTRPETLKEAKAVVARAKVLGFEGDVVSLYPLMQTDEATLRARRYTGIWKLASTHDIGAICTAHHQDDDAEGFVMSLFGLGGGCEGAGMPVERKLLEGVVIRPLLPFSRSYLLSVLGALGANDYICDPSNDKGEAKRSQVRNWMQADLHRFHPNPKARLALVASRRIREVQALDRLAGDLVELGQHDDEMWIRVTNTTPSALVAKALAKGLERLAPGEDFRGAAKIVDQVLKKVKKIHPDQGEGLDQGPHSFTVSSQDGACFDFTKVQAKVTRAGIWLWRRDKNDAFAVQSAGF
jgi:tRNA(Ile)-lysidine synthetase-like protein